MLKVTILKEEVVKIKKILSGIINGLILGIIILKNNPYSYLLLNHYL